jgi:hypothetical protein
MMGWMSTKTWYVMDIKIIILMAVFVMNPLLVLLCALLQHNRESKVACLMLTDKHLEAILTTHLGSKIAYYGSKRLTAHCASVFEGQSTI